MTTAWKNFGCFFPFSGRGAGGKAPLCPPGREAAPGPAWRGQSGVLRASESQGWEVWGFSLGWMCLGSLGCKWGALDVGREPQICMGNPKSRWEASDVDGEPHM